MFEYNIKPLLNERGLTKLYPSIVKLMVENLEQMDGIVLELKEDYIIKTNNPNINAEEIFREFIELQDTFISYGMTEEIVNKILSEDLSRNNIFSVIKFPSNIVQWYCMYKHNIGIGYNLFFAGNLLELANRISSKKFGKTYDNLSGLEMFYIVTQEMDNIVDKINQLPERTRMALYLHLIRQDDENFHEKVIMKSILLKYLQSEKDIIKCYLVERCLNGLDIATSINDIKEKDVHLSDRICTILEGVR